MSTDIHNISWPGWETVRLIGRGSFGAVYEIRRDVFGDIEKAAMKVISIPQHGTDIEEMYGDGYDDASITSTFDAHLKRIVAEYTMMKKMNACTNIVSCNDIRYERHLDGVGWDIFIKMELLTPLAKSLPDSVSEDIAMKMGHDICLALDACKAQGIVHRDIKPQNIFLSDNGEYKLGDFGIAKTMERTMGGTKIGTFKYMAPEVYNNQPYGHSADIYSLGLVMYWLLNERRMPFLPLHPTKMTVEMEREARARRLSGEPLPPPANGSAELKAIVLKACAHDPKERFSNAAEMRDELAKLIKRINSVEHTLRFVDADGTVITEQTYLDGQEIVPPRAPTKSDSKNRKYKFVSWSPTLPETVSCSQTFTAKYEIVPLDAKQKKKVMPVMIPAIAALLVILVIAYFLRSPTNQSESREDNTAVSSPSVPDDKEESSGFGALFGQDDTHEVEWSSWLEELPKNIDIDDIILDTKTQYRKATLEMFTEVPKGYTVHYTRDGGWSEASAWQTTPVTESETVKVTTYVSYEYRKGYYEEIGDAYHSSTKRQWVETDWISSSTPVYVGGNIIEVRTVTYYSYQEKIVEYYCTKDSGWTEFSDEPIYPKDGIMINTRTLIRYAERNDSSAETRSASMDNFAFTENDHTKLLWDVESDKWYGGPDGCINTVIDLGILSADRYQYFHPNEAASIADVIKAAAIIHQIYYGNPEITALPGEFDPYIAYAVEYGLISKGVFKDYTLPTTREQTAYIFWKVLPPEELTGLNTVSKILDMDSNSLYYKAVYQMAQAGIISWPTPEYNFNPYNNVTKAEVAAFVDRIVRPENRISN